MHSRESGYNRATDFIVSAFYLMHSSEVSVLVQGTIYANNSLYYPLFSPSILGSRRVVGGGGGGWSLILTDNHQ